MSASARSGFAMGILAFMTNLGVGAFLAICTPFCGIVWGAAAGFLSVYWSDDDLDDQSPARTGATAGAIAGVGAVLGLIVGLVLQFAALGSQEMMTELLLDLFPEISGSGVDGDLLALWQWISLGFTACCLGLVNIAVMAGAGAIAANIYSPSRNRAEPA